MKFVKPRPHNPENVHARDIPDGWRLLDFHEIRDRPCQSVDVMRLWRGPLFGDGPCSGSEVSYTYITNKPPGYWLPEGTAFEPAPSGWIELKADTVIPMERVIALRPCMYNTSGFMVEKIHNTRGHGTVSGLKSRGFTHILQLPEFPALPNPHLAEAEAIADKAGWTKDDPTNVRASFIAGFLAAKAK